MAEKKTKRKLPSVRLACFCENALEEADGIFSLIRIFDSTTVQILTPLPDPVPENAVAPHRVIFFVILDDAKPWEDEFLEFQLFFPTSTKPVFQESICLDRKPMQDVANFRFPVDINAITPGVFRFVLRIGGMKLVERRLNVRHGVVVGQPEQAETNIH